MSLIEIVAALTLILTSALILAAVWFADRPLESAKTSTHRVDAQPRYPKAA